MTLKVDEVQNTSGGPVTLTKQYAAKGWMKYDQYNNIVDDSENVSSVTDTATGRFAQNHTNNMSNGNYSTNCMSGHHRVFATNRESDTGANFPDSTTIAYFESVYNSSGASFTDIDMAANGTVIHGDLA